MTNLTETPQWETGVYRIELSTPVQGGAPTYSGDIPISGYSNVQASQLANRTSYLKQQIETLAAMAISFPSYAELRAYSGIVTLSLVSDYSIGGNFKVDSADTTSPDNGGTIIVDALNRRWKRIDTGDINVKWFGAIGNGSTDDTIAIQSAITYAATIKAGLHFPAGKYLVTSTLSASLSGDGSIAISGDGRGVSVVELSTSGDGIVLTLPGNWWLYAAGGSNGVSVSDITFCTTNTNTGVGFSIVGSSVEGRPGPSVIFSNVEWRAKTNFGQFWNIACQITDMGDVWMTNPRCVIGGPSNTTSKFLRLDGAAQANSPVCFHITDAQVYYGGTQIELGDYVEGVYITQPHMVGGNIGISWVPAIGESGLHLTGGHISSKTTCIYLDDVFDVNIYGTLIYREGTTSNYRGLHVQNVGRLNIGAGVVFKGTNSNDGETAIYIQSSVNDERYGGLISGASFHSFATRAIWLSSTANYIHVGDCIFRQCAVRVLNQSISSNVSFSPKTYVANFAAAVTGGASTENLNVTLPTGMFLVKPGAGFLQSDSGSALQVVGTLDNANTTTTNARFVLRNPSGGNIVGNTYRFSVVVFESTDDSSF